MDNLQPQLMMMRDSLDELPSPQLPPAFRIRSFREGDEPAWEAIIREAFADQSIGYGHLTGDDAYRPERVWFVCDGGRPVATAAAWHREAWGERTGYLHMVGALKAYGGQGLGLAAVRAAMRRMAEEGRSGAVLHTDDFRIPAIKIYLRAGFRPVTDTHPAYPERWAAVADALGPAYRSFFGADS